MQPLPLRPEPGQDRETRGDSAIWPMTRGQIDRGGGAPPVTTQPMAADRGARKAASAPGSRHEGDIATSRAHSRHWPRTRPRRRGRFPARAAATCGREPSPTEFPPAAARRPPPAPRPSGERATLRPPQPSRPSSCTSTRPKPGCAASVSATPELKPASDRVPISARDISRRIRIGREPLGRAYEPPERHPSRTPSSSARRLASRTGASAHGLPPRTIGTPRMGKPAAGQSKEKVGPVR